MESVVTAVTECRKLNQLFREVTVTKYRNPSTAYQMCSDNTRKITYTGFWKRAVTQRRKSYTMLAKRAMKTYANPFHSY